MSSSVAVSIFGKTVIHDSQTTGASCHRYQMGDSERESMAMFGED